MADNDSFMTSINTFVATAKANQEEVIRATGIKILARLVDMSPVGNPEVWSVNQTAVAYNKEVFDYNEALKSDAANLTKTGRLKRKARVSDGMDVKAPPGYTGGRFRGNWQVSLDAPATGETGVIDKSGGATKAAGGLVMASFKVGTKSIYFCNNVPYAYLLEFGHSKQAPGGMVRITAEEFQRFFTESVQEVGP